MLGRIRLLVFAGLAVVAIPGKAASDTAAEKFAQLEALLPTPDEVRLASGAPGPRYWQQRVDYDIEVELDEAKHRIEGRETITYKNNSPHQLDYLWLQLDQNILRRDSARHLTEIAPGFEKLGYDSLARLLELETFEGGFDIRSVRAGGDSLPHTIVGTMMRIDLARPLEPGATFRFEVEWAFNIVEATVIWARGGYEHFDKDGNDIFTIAQWHPRLASYDDVDGWQHKQFLGRGEFTLELGDYRVAITVPDGHIVAATGVLQNPRDVLTSTQRRRYDQAKKAERPVFIVNPVEARENQREKRPGTKTWEFEAEDVRDFAFASSRKFVWDAQQWNGGERPVMAMSLYPVEAEPLWSTYSTHAILHTLDVYSRHTFDYPYPVAISVNGPIGGMEYPMICFNGPRAEEDGTYYDKSAEGKAWRRSKYGLISVIIHEVGHNWFPMIVNSDERQWTWMDEGLNSFLQFIAEQEWEQDYPSWRGHPRDIVGFMKSTRQVPIMTNSESLMQFGNNAYAKPATALNILRETILGRNLFDFAFRKYARRWRFKRPMPADFFRSMEDASGVDLDWFWRGWFYSSDHVDIGISGIRQYTLDTRNPDLDKPAGREERDEKPKDISEIRNEDSELRVNRFPELKDFYNEYDPLDITEGDREGYEKLLGELEDDEKELLATERFFYVVEFTNHGGLVMPIIVEIAYTDGQRELVRIPAEIWRFDDRRVAKLFMTKKEIVGLALDPHLETADADTSNNKWPREPVKSRFQLFKESRKPNAMQEATEVRPRKGDDAVETGATDEGAKDRDRTPQSQGPKAETGAGP